MPEGWGPVQNNQKQVLVKVPIAKAVRVLKSLGAGNSIAIDSNIIIARNYDDSYKMMVPASRSSGGDVFLEPELNALMKSGRFDKVSNSMVASFIDSNLEQVVATLQKHNTSVSLLPYQLEMIRDEVAIENKEEMMPDQLVEEVKKEIQARKQEAAITPRPPVASLAMIRIKAKAAKAKLLLTRN